MAVYDGLMGSLLGGNLTRSDGSMGDPEPPPVIIVVTATPEPTPEVVVVTATPEPHPVSAASTPTPAQGSLSAKTSMTLPAATVIPTVVPTATPVRVVASPTPVLPAVTPTPPPVPPPNLRHLEHKQDMLELINAERIAAGLSPVVLGDNVAAQLHAEASLAGCFSGHWGADGLKPYMRYSLAGGYQSNGENGHGSDYCIKTSDGYRGIDSIEQEIREAMDGWMSSPGHRRNILGKWHKKVNIGLAWDRYNFIAIQHFEGGYVEYDHLPVIDDGLLIVSGRVTNGVRFTDDRDLGVQIYYDPPPYPLTRGQLARTYCYASGRPIASLRPSLTGGWFYEEHEFTMSYDPCPSPYDVPPDAPAPRSANEAHLFWQAAYEASQRSAERLIRVPWITALEWNVSGGAFSVTADLLSPLADHGDGVYTLIVWAVIGDEDVVISQYSIFHGITPPDTYTP